MSAKCNFCGAMKFLKEMSRTTTCCNDGKVQLTPFPRPPEALMNLWMGNDAKSRLFKLHSRQLNNAVCISSLQVKEKNVAGFNPSVIFQGRHHMRTGALLPATGEQPVYAQLYVYDAGKLYHLEQSRLRDQFSINESGELTNHIDLEVKTARDGIA